jgi:hypothetical protein
MNLKNWQTLDNKEELFREFQDLLRNNFAYPYLEYFNSESNESSNIIVEITLKSNEITELEINYLIKQFCEKLQSIYVEKIKEKAPKKQITIKEFQKQIYPQEVSQKDNLLFCCFMIPISFEDFDIVKTENKYKIIANVSIVDDQLKEYAVEIV